MILIIKAEFNKTKNSINIIENYSNILHINLNDNMLNLNLTVKVTYKGKQIFRGNVKRKISNLYQSMKIIGDSNLTFSAGLDL